MTSTKRTAIWNRLARHGERLANTSIAGLFDAEPDRLKRFSREAAGLYIDLSKNLIDAQTLSTLTELASVSGLRQAREDMFNGVPINRTEDRAVLHTLLRTGAGDRIPEATMTLAGDVTEVRERLKTCVAKIHNGDWRGCDGERITDVVNIGIGGSHLGPQLVVDALRYEHTGHVHVYFVANVDGGEIDRVLSNLNPATTLFIVASKSFTTAETMLNAGTARDWFEARFGQTEKVSRHFIAVTAYPSRAVDFGIDASNVLPMWDWVGGRFSLWSAIGLPIALAIGNEGFDRLLAGAATLDRHFLDAEFESNLPVLLALVGIWNTNILGIPSQAVVPYDDRLRFLPSYLQQLEMESNGKRVRLDDELSPRMTAGVVWGSVGTNAQHAFFQMLHQGTHPVSVDFLVALSHPRSPRRHHDQLVANCFAQAQALMQGRARSEFDELDRSATAPSLALHRETPGNRPTTMLLAEDWSAATLGALIALYEHKTFVQGIIWGINSFDQWGVELGKELAGRLLKDIESGSNGAHDASTKALLQRYRARRDRHD